MSEQRTNSSSMLLIELISAILVFSICCAICVGLFIESDKISKSSVELTKSVFLAQSAADCLHGDYEANLRELGLKKKSSGVYSADYSEYWELTDTDAKYSLTVDLNGDSAKVTVSGDDGEIFSVEPGVTAMIGEVG